MPGLGRALILVGVALVALGAIVMLAGKLPWLGRLPGDIHIERDGFSFHFPIVTCILVSAIISLVLYLLRR
jgi:hypothetical protein